MIASRRLINLAGILLVVIALAVGTILTAVPIYLESRSLNAQEQDVAAANRLIQTQIDALHAKEAELPQVEQDLADLHNQLPRIPQLDDATQLVVKAADKVKASIQSVEFGDAMPFAARDAGMVIDQLPQTATNVSTDDPNSIETNGDAADAAGPEGSEADASSKPVPAGPEPVNRLQFQVTIKVTAPDQVAANRFLDEVRSGPRLFQIDTVTGETDEDSAISLTVTGLVFVSLST